jgi:hypothetical protein
MFLVAAMLAAVAVPEFVCACADLLVVAVHVGLHLPALAADSPASTAALARTRNGKKGQALCGTCRDAMLQRTT